MTLFLASDNVSGCHPTILSDLTRCASGTSVPYGGDAISKMAKEAISDLLGITSCEIAFVFNGTAANVLGLTSVLARQEAIIASDTSHIWADEVGAIENFSGSRIIPMATYGKKLTPENIRSGVAAFPPRGSLHKVRARVVSISQTTEFGLVYTPEEIRALSECAHSLGLLLHVDGARLSNAATCYGSFKDALGGDQCDRYIDILSLGATKNGAMCADAIVFMGQARHRYNIQLQKQGLNLASKQRFLSSQFLTMFGTNLWRENAERANSCAKKLEEIIKKYAGTSVTFFVPVESNMLFLKFPAREMEEFLVACSCYLWNVEEKIVRIVTAWSTTDEEIDQFEAIIKAIFSK